MNDVIPLHAWSGYSFGRGSVRIADLVCRAAELGYKALALTDINSLCGASAFYQQAQEAGLKPIIGAELRDPQGDFAVALVMDRAGYENLCQAVTRLCAEETQFRLVRDLPSMSEGLHIISESAALVEALARAGVPLERLWLELDSVSQPRMLVQRLIDDAGRLGAGLLATRKALFLSPEDYDLTRLVFAIGQGTTFDRVKPSDLPHPKAYLRPLRQRVEVEAECSEFASAVRNNQHVAEQCNYRVCPREPVFPHFATPPGQSPREHLRQLCREGARWRYGSNTPPPGFDQRLARELDLIERKGFSEYFLVVQDIVQFARRCDAPIAGRGSGASSLVAYLLGITNVCPLTYAIPFERFLNERREDFPDLDIDFCWRIRDDVIRYAFQRWGEDRVAMVSTHNLFQERSAFRETAKAMGLADSQVSKLERQAQRPGVMDKPLQRIVALAQRLVGLPHLLSVHPGGIVIGRDPIDHYVPIQPAQKGVMITQYDKDGVEDIGLVKLDLLGNRALSTIREAGRRISQREGRSRIDIEQLPADDAATFELIRRADTIGCNQLESPAMRHLMLNLQPRDIRDIMKALALIRPGAASIGMKDVFVRRQRGFEPPPPTDARAEGVLRDTHGIMLYEDDVMLLAAALLGTDLAQGDRFRKAVQKCHTDQRRLELSQEFLRGCVANGVDLELAKSLWVQMAKFNAYSFCRAHAASYGRLAYAVAYLKAHHPLEFWTAALNNNQSMYHPRLYVEEARRVGIHFLPPDVNRSGEEYEIEGGAIRVGLNRIAGVGPVSIQSVLEARGRGPIESLSDCMDRAALGRDEAHAMILAGAFDGLAVTRPGLMMELNLYRPGRRGRAPALLTAQPTLTEVLEDFSPHRKYWDQLRTLEISVGEHPLSLWRLHLPLQVDTTSSQLPSRVGRRVRIAGLLEAYRSAQSQSGRQIKFFTFDDEQGAFEVTAFADSCRLQGKPGASTSPGIITGRVEEHYGAFTVSAERIAWCEPAEPPEN